MDVRAQDGGGYRLPGAARPGRVRLRVADPERSLAFYRDVLGMRVARDEGSVLGLAAAGEGPELVELRGTPGLAPARQHGRLGLYHFAVLVPTRAELGRVLGRLSGSGFPLGASDHAVSEALYTVDPDGNSVEIYVDRPQSTWRYHGGELHMTTLPLDTHALLREAAPDTGALAEGASIGHMHFYMDDLARADAFYRVGLGMDASVWSYSGALFLAAGGYHHHVGTNVWAGPGATRTRDDEAGLLDWELLVPSTADADASAGSLRAAGFEATQDDGAWVAADPVGNVVRIVVEVD
jgi:catechol 2,3-dioxygenase